MLSVQGFEDSGREKQQGGEDDEENDDDALVLTLSACLEILGGLASHHQETETEKDQIENIAAQKQRHRQIRHAADGERDQAERKRAVETDVTGEGDPKP